MEIGLYIPILVGSVMGTAESVAHTIHNQLVALEYNSDTIKDFKPENFSSQTHDALIICCSNTGMGDLPANIVPFYHHLTTDYPKIAGLKYGLISLGDSSYPNFAQAGKTLDDAMQDLGAIRIGEHRILDALEVCDYPQAAKDWLSTWAIQFQNSFNQ